MFSESIFKGSTVEEQATFLLKEAKNLAPSQSAELTLDSLAPKKPNWDLKRDLEKKSAKLDEQTADAVIELVRERFCSNI